MTDSQALTGGVGRLRSAVVGRDSRQARRGRIPKACIQCHTRKQKCDGRQPCRNCALRKVSSQCRPFSQKRYLDETGIQRRISQDSAAPVPNSQQDESLSHTGATEPFATNEEHMEARNHNEVRLGQLWKSRGAPSFFGSSYFGPQVAAALLDTSAPYVQPGANMSRRSTSARPFRDEAGPFSQLWDLLGLLPLQRSIVDRLVNLFLDHVNNDIDAVHEPSFRQEYERFYSRKAVLDDVTTVDIRWLALLFIVLAIGAYLDCPRDAGPEKQREYEESSMSFFWACRKAIVIAPSFYGESTDLVRAGILVTRFCVFNQRITESWLAVGFAARLAMAQGLHIDGVHWKLSRRATESRRRLWCQLYLLDRMISLALGRPYCIIDNLSVSREPDNVFLDNIADAEAESVHAEPIPDSPTPSIVAIFSYRLAKVIGQIHEQTFGPQGTSYRQVMSLDAQLVAWKQSLPQYLDISQPDTSRDEGHAYLRWHRLYLHTAFHFACITLHRPFVWRTSITDQYRYSREVCFASACADLKTRLEHHEDKDLINHYSWRLGMPQLFNSAVVLGMMVIQEQSRGVENSWAVINDLQAFCDKENNDTWTNDFRLAEVRVIELCIDRLKRGRRTKDGVNTTGRPSSLCANQSQEQRRERPPSTVSQVNAVTQPPIPSVDEKLTQMSVQGAQSLPPLVNQHQVLEQQTWEPDVYWSQYSSLDSTLSLPALNDLSKAFSFPGPTDLDTWQGIIDAIDRQNDNMIDLT